MLYDYALTLNECEGRYNGIYTNTGSTAEETPMQLESTSLEGLMNHIGLLVKLLIKFAKKLNDFTALPQAAQVTLLKGKVVTRTVLVYLKVAKAANYLSLQCLQIENGSISKLL